MKATFTTPVVQAEGMKAAGLRVPAEAVATLGTGKRPKVRAILNGYTYRSTVAAYGDVFVPRPVMERHGIHQRTVQIPEDGARLGSVR